jgi:hypothetical protein
MQMKTSTKDCSNEIGFLSSISSGVARKCCENYSESDDKDYLDNDENETQPLNSAASDETRKMFKVQDNLAWKNLNVVDISEEKSRNQFKLLDSEENSRKLFKNDDDEETSRKNFKQIDDEEETRRIFRYGNDGEDDDLVPSEMRAFDDGEEDSRKNFKNDDGEEISRNNFKYDVENDENARPEVSLFPQQKCLRNSCEENEICAETENDFKCECKKGFELRNGKCRHVYECKDCQWKCSNLNGGFECICPNGYERNLSGLCIDIDECKSNVCGAGEVCTNVKGSKRCTKTECPIGYHRYKNTM